MTSFFYEHRMRQQFREMAERDRELTRWGWYWRGGHHPRSQGLRFRIGAALIRLGWRLQGRLPDASPRALDRV